MASFLFNLDNIFTFTVIVDVFVDAGVANFVCRFDHFINIVGNSIDFAIIRSNRFNWLHLSSKESIERFPEGFAN